MPGQDIQKLLSPCLSKTHKHFFFWSSLGFDYRNSLKEEAIVTVDALNKVTKSADDPNWNTDSVFFSWRRNMKQSCTGKLVWPVARTSHYYQMCLVFFFLVWVFFSPPVRKSNYCLLARDPIHTVWMATQKGSARHTSWPWLSRMYNWTN